MHVLLLATWLTHLHLLLLRKIHCVHLHIRHLLLLLTHHLHLRSTSELTSSTHWHVWLLTTQLERVLEVWYIKHIENDLHVVFPYAFLLDDVLHLEGVDAHLLCLTNKRFFQNTLMHVELLRWVNLLPKRELSLNTFPLFLFGGPRWNVSGLKVARKLIRNLLQGFLCKFECITFELSIGNELNDVTTHVLPVFLRV